MPERNAEPVGGFVSAPVKVVHDWVMWSLVRGDFTDPDGEHFTRTFVLSPGAVGVVALRTDASGKAPTVILVRQYRPALHRLTLEIPAGMRDQAGEDPLVTAQRELQEEVGVRAASWLRLGCHVSSPGISNSQVEIFLARDLQDVGFDRHGPEERHMTIEEISLSDAIAMVLDGRIDDAKTVIGLLHADRIMRQG